MILNGFSLPYAQRLEQEHQQRVLLILDFQKQILHVLMKGMLFQEPHFISIMAALIFLVFFFIY
jgi:hypothetical protein